MCWQGCCCYDGPSSFHILVWTKELQLVTQTKTQINVQGPYPGQMPLASTQSSVRSGQTCRSTSRPQLRSKFNLTPGKSTFLTLSSSGMATRQPCFIPVIPPDTSHSRHKKIKNLHISSKPFPFLLFTVCVGLRSESS